MLKLSGRWLIIALVPGLLGFSGLMPATHSFFQVFFFVCLGFVVLSLLLSLFEEVEQKAGNETALRVVKLHTEEQPRLWFPRFSTPPSSSEDAREAA